MKDIILDLRQELYGIIAAYGSRRMVGMDFLICRNMIRICKRICSNIASRRI